MERLLRTSLKVISKLDLKKYSWVVTTASVLALILYQNHKDYRNDDEDHASSSNPNESKSEKENINNSGKSTQSQQDQQNSNQQEQYQDRRHNNSSSLNPNKHNIEQKKRSSIGIFKKQINSDSESKQSLKNSGLFGLKGNNQQQNGLNSQSNSSNKSSRFSTGSKRDDFYNSFSDNETSRTKIVVKKQRRFASDTDERSLAQRKNQILRIGHESSPNDAIFFQVLASLAENEEEYE